VAGFGTFPHWLPDSQRLVFQGHAPSDRNPNQDFPQDDSLHVADRLSGRVHEVLSVPGAALDYPVLSPDGRWLVFVRTTLKADVWTLTSDTGL
jgi:Tol biopolymer transport system component